MLFLFKFYYVKSLLDNSLESLLDNSQDHQVTKRRNLITKSQSSQNIKKKMYFLHESHSGQRKTGSLGC